MSNNTTDTAPVRETGADTPSQGLSYPSNLSGGSAASAASGTSAAPTASPPPGGGEATQPRTQPPGPPTYSADGAPRRGMRNKPGQAQQAKETPPRPSSYRQRVEELKIGIIQLTGRNAESTMRVIRTWIKEDKGKN